MKQASAPLYRYASFAGRKWIPLVVPVILFLLWMLSNDVLFAAGTPLLVPLLSVRALLITTIVFIGWAIAQNVNIRLYTRLLTMSVVFSVILEMLTGATRPPEYNPGYISLATIMFLYLLVPASPRHKIVLGSLYSVVFLVSASVFRTHHAREIVQIFLLVGAINLVGIQKVIAEDRLRGKEVQYHEQTSRQYHNQKVIANATDTPILLLEQGQLIDCNKSMEELWGTPYTDLIGRECSELIDGIPPFETVVTGVEQQVPVVMRLSSAEREAMASILAYTMDEVPMMVISLQTTVVAENANAGVILRSPQELVALVDEVCQLTQREKDVARGILSGWDRNTIGNRLFISPATVRAHTSSIYAKLGVHSKVEFFNCLMEQQFKDGCSPTNN